MTKHKYQNKFKIQIPKQKVCYLVLVLCNCLLVSVLSFIISHAYAQSMDMLKRNFLQGDYTACIKEGEALVNTKKRNIDNNELHYILGLSYLKEGNPLGARQNFKFVLNVSGKSRFKEEAQIGLGDGYFIVGDYTLADFQYQDLLNRNPKTKFKPGVYLRLSQLQERTGNMEKAKEYSAKLRKEFPFSPEAKANKDLFPENNIAKLSKETVIEKKSDHDVSMAYSVQVGAFSSSKNAGNLAKKLRAKGYSVYVEEASSLRNKIYKVRVGTVLNRSDAQELEKRLKKQGYPTKIIP